MKFALYKTTIAACTALLTLGTFSCREELLSPTPQTQFSDQVVFSNPARIALQVNGLYSYVKVGNFLGGRVQIYGDIRADDFINRTSNNVTGLSVWNHTETETSQNDIINMWGAGYAAINQINVFLAGLDANAASFVAPTFPSDFATTANQYRGEARLLRALCYYTMLQFYARPYIDANGTRPGLPLRLQAETNLSGNNLARSTVAEVYAQIINDLKFAEDNLPATYGNASTNVTRAHRNTAIALKTRVYLAMGSYSDVSREAAKIVTANAAGTSYSATNGGVANALNSSIANVFAAPQETSESILSFPFTTQDAPGTQNQLAYYYLPPLPSSQGGNGEFTLNANGILANPGLAATDVRRTAFVTTYNSDPYLKKYPTLTPFTDKAPVIRYAEVLLSYAEALARTGNSATALNLLNAVRTRSNPAGAYTAASLASSTDLVNAILLERRIEFLGEGLRNTDLLRLNATIPGKGPVKEVPYTDSRYVWPIPSSELLTNSLIVRN